VRDWLLATGVIVPNPSGSLGNRSAYLDSLWNTGANVITDRMVFDSAQSVTPPDCPHCIAPLDVDHYMDQLGPWLSGEPTVQCPACGRSALLGDWSGEWTCQVGNLSVRFTNWPPLRDDFVGELGRRLGLRWRVVRAYR
jgi:hypothetical protein